MKPESSAHLSQEALDDVLIGLGSPESEVHLAVCAACRGQLERFQSSVRAFNQASMAWSEVRAEAKPVKQLRDHTSRARVSMFAPLGWAMAAALLLVIGIPVWNREHRPVVEQNPAAASTSGDSEAQIAEDNNLLKSIDAALNASEASPVSEYHLSEEPRVHRKTRPDKARPELRKR